MTTTQDILNHINWTGDTPERLAALCLEIEEWTKKESNIKTRNTSESFAGYNVSRSANQNGTPQGWQDVFKAELDVYRKPRIL